MKLLVRRGYTAAASVDKLRRGSRVCLVELGLGCGVGGDRLRFTVPLERVALGFPVLGGVGTLEGLSMGLVGVDTMFARFGGTIYVRGETRIDE
jgi:hypothetical protein